MASTIPYYQPLGLSDFVVASGLHRRLQADISRPTWRLCGDEASFGYDETCGGRRRQHPIARHDQVVLQVVLQVILAIVYALNFLDAFVEIKPLTYECRRRKNIRLAGLAARGYANVDHDLKVYSLMANQAHATPARKADDTSFIDHSLAQRNRYWQA